MLGPVARITGPLRRNVLNTTVRNSHHGPLAPGENLPFDVNNRWRFTLTFFLYVGSGLAAPFLIALHQMKKK